MIPAVETFDSGQPMVTLFRDASGHGARADLLLTMPLDIILRYNAELQATCVATGLAAGERYCALVLAALTARRTATGEFPGDMADQIATDGADLQEIANQWRPVKDTDGHCRRVSAPSVSSLAALVADGDPAQPNPHCKCPPTRAAREACPAWRFT